MWKSTWPRVSVWISRRPQANKLLLLTGATVLVVHQIKSPFHTSIIHYIGCLSRATSEKNINNYEFIISAPHRPIKQAPTSKQKNVISFSFILYISALVNPTLNKKAKKNKKKSKSARVFRAKKPSSRPAMGAASRRLVRLRRQAPYSYAAVSL